MNPWAWWRRTFFGALHWCSVNGALLLFTIALATYCAYASFAAIAAWLVSDP